MNFLGLAHDYFSRSIIGRPHLGRTQKIRDAFAKCVRHPSDMQVLETYSPDGLFAIHDPYVKAVIWHRDLAPELQRAVASLTAADAAEMTSVIYGEMPEGSTEYDDVIPVPLGNDLETLYSAIEKVSPCFALNYSGKFMSRAGFDSNSYNIHSDDDNDGYTMHVTYKEPGLEWFPGDFTHEEYEELSAITHSTDYPPGLRSEFTKAGDVILFKGQNTCHRVPNGCVRGLLHRTPDGNIADGQGNPEIPPPLASANDRLIYTMY